MAPGDMVRIKKASQHFALDPHELHAGLLIEVIEPTTSGRVRSPIGRVLFGATREIYPMSILEGATQNEDC